MSDDSKILKLPKPFVLAYFIIIGLVLVIVAICDDVTGDNGDSISHYMFSKYSWDNPHYFIDHWAKPVFTFLSSPFSQFGFVGIRCFNVLMALGTAYIVWQIAERLKKPLSPFVILILFSIAFYTLKMYSGYTEYLYAFLLVLAIFLCISEKLFLAVILVSFFPFCRSEGMIGLGIFALFLLWSGNWKYIPLLAIGHVFYELVGMLLFDESFGWTWNKIPYIGESSGYGSGKILDMPWELMYRTDIPILLMTIFGLIYTSVGIFLRRNKISYQDKINILLIYGNAVAFFLAHSIFWTFGLFNSFGLGRVYIAIMPLIALIALDGFGLLKGTLFSRKLSEIIATICLVIIIAAPFNKNKVGFRYIKGINNIPENDLVRHEIQPYLETYFPDNKVYYNIAYLAVVRDENYFAQGTQGTWFRKPDLETMKVGSIFVWDSKFAQGDGKILKGDLEADPRFKNHKCFESNTWNGNYNYCVFERISL